MTIDEALNLLNNSKPKSNNAFSIQMNEAINVIGVTIHKYQQIEEIVNNTFQNIAKEDERYAYEWLGDIKEIIEDGNDN